MSFHNTFLYKDLFLRVPTFTIFILLFFYELVLSFIIIAISTLDSHSHLNNPYSIPADMYISHQRHKVGHMAKTPRYFRKGLADSRAYLIPQARKSTPLIMSLSSFIHRVSYRNVNSRVTWIPVIESVHLGLYQSLNCVHTTNDKSTYPINCTGFKLSSLHYLVSKKRENYHTEMTMARRRMNIDITSRLTGILFCSVISRLGSGVYANDRHAC